MPEYRLEPFDLVQNSRQYKYSRLFIDGICQFDNFVSKIEKNTQYLKQFRKIITLMELISDQHILNSRKFNHIKGVGRSDVFEFKSDDLRIYVIKKNPDMYIILGGYKKNQDEDIRILKNRLKTINL